MCAQVSVRCCFVYFFVIFSPFSAYVSVCANKQLLLYTTYLLINYLYTSPPPPSSFPSYNLQTTHSPLHVMSHTQCRSLIGDQLIKFWTTRSSYKKRSTTTVGSVSRFGLAVRREAGKRKDLGSIPLRLSVLFKKVVVCGHCPVTLSITSY